MGVSTTPDTMHLMILVSLAAAASAAPQIVPYQHVEIEAEPYIHEEIEAEPYVHIEPELTAEALGIITRNQPAAAPVAAPVQLSPPDSSLFLSNIFSPSSSLLNSLPPPPCNRLCGMAPASTISALPCPAVSKI